MMIEDDEDDINPRSEEEQWQDVWLDEVEIQTAYVAELHYQVGRATDADEIKCLTRKLAKAKQALADMYK